MKELKTLEEKQEAIRRRRKLECFPIVNRGIAWYHLLTVEQETELKEWYVKWLNAPETLDIPVKPKWLSEKLDTEVEYL